MVEHGWLCAPGVVLLGVISEHGLSQALPHALLVPPFPWEQLRAVSPEEGPGVHWLLVVPISDPERLLLEDRGYHVLEALFVEHEVRTTASSGRPFEPQGCDGQSTTRGVSTTIGMLRAPARRA